MERSADGEPPTPLESSQIPMQSPDASPVVRFRFERTLQFTFLAFCVGFALVDLYVIFARMFYPFQLEWMEGASLVQVSRLLGGQALYVQPSVDFVPLVYPPLYFYVAAGLARVMGSGFGPLRIVSVLSSLGCGGILFLALKKYSDTTFSGLLSLGIFASPFVL